MLNNYKEALDILEQMPIRIEILLSGRGSTEATFTKWLEDEHRYLESKRQEPNENILSAEYIQQLQSYENAKYVITTLLCIAHQLA